MKRKNKQGARQRRIGIFAGAFDPVHAGHVAFALQALEQAGLDEVVFLPERRPRQSPEVEHFAHRIGMIRRAIRPYRRLSVLELADRNFTVSRTLPQLEGLFRGSELIFITGSDAAESIPQWPYAHRLLDSCGLVVGVHSQNQAQEFLREIETWAVQPHDLTVVQSYASDVSSARIRQALRAGIYTKGLLTSVGNYARREWLYVSVT